MARIGIAVAILGVALTVLALASRRLADGATEEPIPVDLAALERGEALPGPHVEIREHAALYSAGIAGWTDVEHSLVRRTPKRTSHVRSVSLLRVAEPDREIEWCMYPVVSPGHPLAPVSGDDLAIAGGVRRDAWESRGYAVLVLTHRYRYAREIPEDDGAGRGVRGLVLNRIRSLDAEETRILSRSARGTDLGRVLILQEGRGPMPGEQSVLLLVGGVLLAGAGVGLIVFAHRRGRERGLRQERARRRAYGPRRRR